MIIFLYGPDDYRREEKKKSVIADFSKKHSDLGIASFDLTEDGALAGLQEYLRSQSMFNSFKLAVLQNIFEEEESVIKEELKNFLEHPSVIILISEKTSPLKAFQFLTKPPVVFQSFENLKAEDFKKFIRAEAKKKGLVIQESAIGVLAAAYANNTWSLVTELEKLSLLNKPEVSIGDLDKLEVESAPGFWELFNGLKNRDLGTRLRTLAKVDRMHEPAAKIFNILSAQWSERLPMLARNDFMVKSGKLEYEEALLELLL